jgi:hypothetical protein
MSVILRRYSDIFNCEIDNVFFEADRWTLSMDTRLVGLEQES